MTDLDLYLFTARLCAAGALTCAVSLTQPTPLTPRDWCTGAECRNWTWDHNIHRQPGDILFYNLSWELDGNLVTGSARLSSRDLDLQCSVSSCNFYTPFPIPPSTTFPHRFTVCHVRADGEELDDYCATHEWRNR